MNRRYCVLYEGRFLLRQEVVASSPAQARDKAEALFAAEERMQGLFDVLDVETVHCECIDRGGSKPPKE
ncbi:MAG: hypothetical protein ACPGUV_09045 [Polyangiales bacterium]